MDTKDLEIIEFPRIRSLLAGYTSFALSREAALALLPSLDLAEVQARLTESAEARALLVEEPALSASGVEDIRALAVAAGRGKVLDPSTLALVRRTLEVMRLLRSHTTPHAEIAPRLARQAEGIASFSALEKAIDRAVSPTGELLPDASQKLRDIRDRQRSTRATLVEQLQGVIAADTAHRYIQEPIVTEREGRYVIAVKAEHRSEVEGIVHDVSNTGATLFLEPWQTLEMGNALKELTIEEAREVERILAELSAQVGEAAPAIETSLLATAELDLALAKAHFAARYRAVEAEVYQPTAAAPPVIKLEKARHPLLGEGAVPLSLELGRDFTILVITGPNTGGKTVALKTLGLMCALTQAGLPIPAAPGTRLPILTGIYADIGDEQSILETLSTFGWHMSNLSRILHKADAQSLVLLDELGAATDPQEGSALARAILLHLLAEHVLGVITTHYTELKVFAHVTPGLQNASFDFDPATLQPTYHLTLGTPGGSNAIATAAHFGLPPEIISEARAFLSPGARQLEELLAGLQAEKQRLEELNRELGEETSRASRQNAELAAELKRLATQKRAILDEARDGVVREVSALEKELKQAEAALRREKSAEAVKSARASSLAVRTRLKSGKLAETAAPAPTDDGAIAVGDTVLMRDTGVTATVTAINERTKQVEAAAGPLRFRVGLDSVSKVSGGVSKPAAPKPVLTPIERAPSELDLRGKRAEEVETLLDSYLSDAALSNRKSVRIIHGFGTGVVRSIVRETAEHHPLVKSFHSAPQNEGGDGATIIELR